MAQYDGVIRISTRIDTFGMAKGEREIRGSMGRVSSAAKKMAAVIASAFAVGKIVQFGKEALEAASDFEAMEAQFSQVFGDLEDTAGKSLSAIAEQAGITEERMKSSYTKIAAFAKTTGMDTASSMELANRAMVAVADSAAFYDRTLEETTESLQSFLKGNFENDAALGLSATEFTRNAAANKLYGKSFIELSEAQKQLTLLQMVEDANKLSGAMGQAAREADTWTNQTGNLNQAWKNLKANLGKIILPGAIQAVKAITNVINSINAMIERLSAAAGAFRSFSELLTGNKSKTGSGVPSGGSTDMASEYNSSAEAAENLADSTEKVAQATKKAKEEAEKYLSPLDEINRYSEKEDRDDSKTSGSGDGTGGPAGAADYGSLAEGETIIDELGEKALKLKEILSGLIKPFKDAWEAEGASTVEAARFAFESLGELARSVGKSFYDVWTNGTGTQTLTLILQIAQNVLMTIGNIADRLNEAWNTNSVGTSIIQNIFDICNTILGTVERITGATAEWAGTLDFYPLLESINGLLESIQPLTENIGDGLAWFYENVLLPIAGWTIEEAVPAFLDMLSAAIGALNEVIEALEPLGEWLWENFLQPLGEWAGDTIISAMETITDLLTKFGDWVSEHQEAVQNMAIIIGSFFAAFKIVTAINGIVDFIASMGGLIGIVKSMAGLVGTVFNPWVLVIGAVIAAGILLYKNWDKIKEAAGKLKDYILKKFELVKAGVSAIWDGIGSYLSEKWELIKTGASTVFNGIKDTISKKWELVKTGTSTVWNGIKDNLSEKWDLIKTGASTAFEDVKNRISNKWTAVKIGTSVTWNAIKTLVSGLWNSIKTTASTKFGEIKTKIIDVWSGLKTRTKEIWNSIMDSIKTPINAIIGFINGMIEGIVGGINSLIRLLNNFKIDIPANPFTDAVSIGFNFQELSVPKIPALATGAVIPPNREFLALLGDQKHGTNIEAPLSTIEEAVMNALLKMMPVIAQNSGSSGNIIHNQVQINRRTLLDEMIEEAKLRQTVSGSNPFELA